MMRTPSVLAVVLALAAPAHATPIPNDPFAAPVPTFVGAPATPRSVPAPAVPQHPFMAPNGRSNIHDDAYQTDTYVGLGPLGRNPEVLSTQQNAECGSLTFDSAGRIVTVCVGFEGPRLAMFDPATLDLLAVFPLPPRSAGGGGVFIVSDHAMYRFDAGAMREPVVTWREVYDRGTRLKPGQVNFGSGTTPTLMGTGWVAITDNADPQMHVVVYWRAPSAPGPRLLCAVPVFAPGISATENSLIGTDTSLLVENNYGYTGPASVNGGATTEPGISRIDVRSTGRCVTRWTSQERVPSTVSKLSLADGLMYAYTKDPGPGTTDAWYLTAISFKTGVTAWKRLVGTGLGYNNNFAPVTLGPDGTAYVGVLAGLTLIRDTP